MPGPNVLIAFYSRCGATEKLALAAAVGAVEARASIRLRRLPDVGVREKDRETPDCEATLRRLRREYGIPALEDFEWADGIVVGMPPGPSGGSKEWDWCLALLDALVDESRPAGKLATVLAWDYPGSSAAHGARDIEASLLERGFVPLPEEVDAAPRDAVSRAHAQGRRAARWIGPEPERRFKSERE